MNLQHLSDKFNESGRLIIADKEKNILNLERKIIISLFEKYGVLLFRDFKNIENNILQFTDKFTSTYANDAQRREKKMNSDKIHGVDPGNLEMPMHSEASYSPSWPDIIWFFCKKAPQQSGKTTVSDGIEIFKNLSLKSKNFFMKNQILYELEIPFKNQSKSKLKDKTDRPWYIEGQGTYDCKINFSKNLVFLKQKRYAVQSTRLSDNLSFCNHLQIILDRDPQVISIKPENGESFPKEIIEDVKKVTKDATIEINWKDNDFMMIDNKRFMHGRTAINEGEKREIINVQTLKSNLSYGYEINKSIQNSETT